MNRRIVFVKYGSFSLVNERVEALLRERFPDHSVVVYDAARDILASRPLQSLGLRLLSSIRELRAFVKGRHSPWDFVFRDVRAWDGISDWIRENIDPAETAFVFQTQGMFDASHPAIPFFIYTDHTRAAHHRQPGGGAPARVGPGWEERERSLYRRADAIFTLSQFCERSLNEDYGITAKKTLTVSTGINIDLPSKIADREKTKPVILFVGVEWEIKGGPELMNAFLEVRKKWPDAELWIVGGGPEALPEGVRGFGRVDRETMARLFSEARVLCVPSRIERASMVALDAAAHGLPVICTPHGAGAERVRDGVTGFLIDPRDTAAFAEVILRFLSDGEIAATMGLAGRRMVEEEFTWSAVGGKIAGRIREVLPEMK
jgi:glycosyltransferase involved in cell wall biosynthesis